jgi:regulatory protein
LSIITSIEEQKRRKKRVSVFLDGKYAFSLTRELAEEMHLKEGQEISAAQAETYSRLDSFHSCLAAAERLLSYRPRSENEMRIRLAKLGFEDDYIEQAVTRLKEIKLLDDSSFARYWVENRSSFSPRSRHLLGLELRQKGIDKETIIEATGTRDEGRDAYRAAQKKAQTLQGYDYNTFRRKLMPYLQRRGFGYGVTKEATQRLWKEFHEGSDLPPVEDSSAEIPE